MDSKGRERIYLTFEPRVQSNDGAACVNQLGSSQADKTGRGTRRHCRGTISVAWLNITTVLMTPRGYQRSHWATAPVMNGTFQAIDGWASPCRQ